MSIQLTETRGMEVFSQASLVKLWSGGPFSQVWTGGALLVIVSVALEVILTHEEMLIDQTYCFWKPSDSEQRDEGEMEAERPRVFLTFSYHWTHGPSAEPKSLFTSPPRLSSAVALAADIPKHFPTHNLKS